MDMDTFKRDVLINFLMPHRWTEVITREDFNPQKIPLRRSFTASVAKQNSIFKLQKHYCQRSYCKIIYLLFLLMSAYLHFLDAFNTR